MSFQEKKTLKEGNTEIVIKALATGNSVGGCAWHITFNNLNVIYAIDLNDKENPVSLPIDHAAFKGANLMISNGYILPELYGSVTNKVYNYINEDKLRNRLEEVLIDR